MIITTRELLKKISGLVNFNYKFSYDDANNVQTCSVFENRTWTTYQLDNTLRLWGSTEEEVPEVV